MQNQKPLSCIEISKANLIHNIKQFRRVIDTRTKISAVVKANAYGHGDVEVVKILNSYVDYFQVNSVEELERVRKFTKKPILVLGYIQKSDLQEAMNLGCIISVFDLHHALLINTEAGKLGIKQKVHIALDSHLGREGIMPAQVARFVVEIKKMKYIKVDGVYSHFANIEDIHSTGSGPSADFSHAQKQIDSYEGAVKIFKENGYSKIQTHISATSGILAYEKWKGINNIARLGIGLYGMWPSVELEKMWKKKISLKPVLKYVTHIAQVKTLPKGHSIGYGLTYITKSEMQIAVIPQGYADGLSRTLSNNGSVLIKGKRAPILGRIAMNMFVVDVSHIKGVKAEDEVVILGTQKGETITAEELARNMGTINYEVTTHLSPLLPRIVK
jgi:alanine racemase